MNGDSIDAERTSKALLLALFLYGVLFGLLQVAVMISM